MLWTAFESDFDHPLVMSFVVQDTASFRLQVAISIAYADGQLHVLIEPDFEHRNDTPVHETLTIQLVIANAFRYCMLFLCDERHDDEWQFTRLQLTLVSPTVALVELEHVWDAGLDSGIFCLGPSDLWDSVASANAMQAVYWIPVLCMKVLLPLLDEFQVDAHKFLTL